jgi:DNA helicase HerA-like ATPase
MIKYIANSFKDIFKDIDPTTMQINKDIEVPNDFYQQLLDYVLERGYLNEVSERGRFLDFSESESLKRTTWLKVSRLPIHPNELKEYDLLSRWQGVLATLHTWGHRLVFVLQRKNGETGLYLGTVSNSRGISSAQAIEQFKEAATGSMPGIDLDLLTKEKDPERPDLPCLQEFAGNIVEYTTAGTITGIPSLKKDTQFGMLQTLDQLAFGVRDSKGIESDFSLVVIADPLNDTVISETISKFRRMGSQIHVDVKRNLHEGESVGQNKGSNLGAGGFVGGIAKLISSGIGMKLAGAVAAGTLTAINPIAGALLSSAPAIAGGVGSMFNMNTGKTHGFSQSVMTEYLDKFAQYAEQVTEMHCERLQRGRNLGFWNTGIYILGKSRRDINTVMGILRSIYSGDMSYVEPIRANILKDDSGAIEIIRRWDLIPLANEHSPIKDAMDEWNVFGKAYQYLSTPMNTEELSLATSLPRRDVPGLRFVKSSVRFANNPAEIKMKRKADGTHIQVDPITLGRVVDTGVVQKNEYRIDPDSLVRHAIVAGSTGCGKTNTCQAIIKEILGRDIPVMIIEPAKDDYVRFALKHNEEVEADNSLTPEQKESRKFNIFMPGVERFEGAEVNRLKINPFQPASAPGAPIDMMTRIEQVTAIINASLPNADILPVIVDEAIFKYVSKKVGPDFMKSEMKPLMDYPALDGVAEVAKEILAKRGYEQKIKDNLSAALETRFEYLIRGKRGDILNVNSSTNFNTLFDRPAIVNVSRISNPKDKALIMSMLMLSLYEYRISYYSYNDEYREKANANKLLHLCVVEEAHNLLMNPGQDFGGTGNPQQVVADLFSGMLSEIRGYGQGLVIVDQIPTRLIPDAIKNTNLKIVHRLTSPDDCSVMAAGLALREDQQKIIPALGVGDTIICGDLDDAAAWVKINKMK